MGVDQKKRDLLNYWNKLEYLNPATVPKKHKVLTNEQMPWHKKSDLEYEVYFAIFQPLELFDFIKNYFQSNEESKKPYEQYITASIGVDAKGYYIKDSLAVSMLPFALGQLKEDIKGAQWQQNFDMQVANIQQYLTRFFIDDHENPVVLEWSALVQINKYIAATFDWTQEVSESLFYTTFPKRQPQNKDAAIVNSHFIKDLEDILDTPDKYWPKALKQYLSGALNERAQDQVDVNQRKDVIQERVNLDCYPDGCWPSEYTLSLMQQFAVNHVINTMSAERPSERIYSVNGPPGTGKTTLLKDIIAANIVNKAKAQSAIKNPQDVYSEHEEIGFRDPKKQPLPFFPIAEEYKYLSDFGMLITSSNNGAVENISKELPQKSKLDEFADQASYFSQVAEQFSEGGNWGLISVAMGKRENINKFVTLLEDPQHGLLAHLDRNRSTSLERWNGAVAAFNNKQREIDEEKDSIRKLIVLNEQYASKQKELQKGKVTLQQTQNDVVEQQSTLTRVQQELVDLGHELEKRWEEKAMFSAQAPGFWARLFRTSSYRAYLVQTGGLELKIKNLSNEIALHEQKVSQLKREVAQKQTQIEEIKQLLANLTRETAQLFQEIQSDDRTHEANFINSDHWVDMSSSNTQKLCPWYLNHLKRLQSELFLLALEVNEAFILTANGANHQPISANLRLFCARYSLEQPKTSWKQNAEIWANLMMVVPVLSATFASIQRMFSEVRANSIPWLFVDEAGQALSQMACGAIWRAKRVVVVGDPLQIEPVNTMPEMLSYHFAQYFGLAKGQMGGIQSVQNVADNRNQLGTTIQSGNTSQWIGTPLKVHRRCIDPMFSIANTIAYDGSMVCETQEAIPNMVLETSFVHLPGSVSGRHYVPEQGKFVLQLIAKEISLTHTLPDIYVISPFGEVAQSISRLLSKELPRLYPSLQVNWNDWIKKSIGTVHTFQGKEAEGVILCLGCDQSKYSAASWAASKPNILNVALTRAKFRFVAIGDKNLWLTLPFFKEMKQLSLVDALAIENK